MRFPTVDGDISKIDEKKTEEMFDYAIANGVNYFDTAWGYHNGQSEYIVGKLLKKYPRESYHIATKLLLRDNVQSTEDAVRVFEEQLGRIGVEYFDYYLFHAVNRKTWKEKILGYGLIPIFEELCRRGRIRHLGFSFHDNFETFREILTYRKWDFCQIQYNYLDTDKNPGARGYELAVELGVPIAVMEPIRGGSLIQLSEEIRAAFSELAPTRSLADCALSWVATHPNVRVVLSGMSTPEQLAQNLNTLGDFVPFTDREMQGIGEIAERLRRCVHNDCTGCRYCMPCPAGVDIPHTFRMLNASRMFAGESERYRKQYLQHADGVASRCVGCGACERVCPQGIGIRADLAYAVRCFEQ